LNLIDKQPPSVQVSRARQSAVDPLRDTEDDQGLDLLHYWRLIRKHWLSILMLGIGGFLLASWYASTVVPMYSASVTIVIDTSRGGATVGTGDSYSYFYAAQMFYQTQQTIIASRELSERAAARLSPAEKERLTRRVEPGPVDQAITSLTSMVRGLLFGARDPEPEATASPDIPRTASGLTRSGGVIQGGKRITSSRDNTQILTVSFTSHDREMTATVANALAEAYIDYTAESRATLSEQSGRWLAQQVERMREKLTESQNALQQFQMREGLVNLDDVQSLASARLQGLNQKLAEAQRNFEDLSKRYGPRHPTLIRAQTELDSARTALSEASRSIVLDADKRFELAKLENDVRSNQEVYELYLSRFRRLDVSTGETISPVYVLDRAQPPGGPFQPNVRRIRLLGLFGGLLFGAFLAWLREVLDNTIHTPNQMEQDLGVVALGSVPFLGREQNREGRRMAKKRRERGAFSVERYYAHHSKSPFAESINHIRTGILYSNAERIPKTILITSAVQSEGKTTLSINLALALSQLGSTLLIDADLRKPRIHQITREKRNAGGMVELLVGQATEEEVLVADEGNESLMLLKSGVLPPNPQEMLASRKFDEMLERFRERFDYIVIDCAPVVPVSDALVVSSKVDAMLLLVKANATPTEMVRDAIRRVRGVGAPLVGTVLTQFDPRRVSHLGRYAYYTKYYTYTYGRKQA
jgi:polysaccharide biosynthesis transport protein